MKNSIYVMSFIPSTREKLENLPLTKIYEIHKQLCKALPRYDVGINLESVFVDHLQSGDENEIHYLHECVNMVLSTIV